MNQQQTDPNDSRGSFISLKTSLKLPTCAISVPRGQRATSLPLPLLHHKTLIGITASKHRLGYLRPVHLCLADSFVLWLWHVNLIPSSLRREALGFVVLLYPNTSA